MASRLFKNTRKIIECKEDIGDYLFHFTKESGDDDALGVLWEILSEGKLKAGKDLGYICFTETPVTLLPALFDYFESFREKKMPPKFSPYGIAFKKTLLFKAGARPVIYSDYGEDKYLDKTIRWRYEVLHPIDEYGEHSYRDYSWMREWRIRKNSITFSPKHCIVITKADDDQVLFQKLCEMQSPDDIPEWYRTYKHISIEKIRNGHYTMSKKDFEEFITNQVFNEIVDDL